MNLTLPMPAGYPPASGEADYPAGSKTGPRANGRSANFTLSAGDLNRSAVIGGMNARENRMMENTSPPGRIPPNPTTERMEYG